MIGSVNTGGGVVLPDLNGSIIRVTANDGANVTVRKGAVKYQQTFNRRIPDEYQEVDYIQSSGTQYIANLPFTYKSISEGRTSLEIDLQFNSSSDTEIPFGSSNYNTGASERWQIVKINGALRPDVCFSSGSETWSPTLITNRLTLKIINKDLFVNDTKYSRKVLSVGDNSSCKIFARSDVESASRAKMKLFSIKTTGAEVCELYPCYRKSDNVIGLYDVVNNQFYTNAGTGTFTKGSDVSTITIDFSVRYSGRWTVTAEQTGEDTVTKYADVIEDNVIYPINVIPKLYLYDMGYEPYEWVAEGKKGSSSASATALAPNVDRETTFIQASLPTISRSGIFYCSHAVDFTDFNRVRVEGDFYNAANYDDNMTLRVWSGIGTYFSDYTLATKQITRSTHHDYLEIDVSNINQTGYIGFTMVSTGSANSYVKITKCFVDEETVTA